MEPADDLRKCYRCGEFKAVDEFSWRRKARDQRDSFCRPCRSAYGKEHYVANRQRYIDQAQLVKQRLRLERTRYLIEYFVAHPCVDCGETDPIVLGFDHLRDKRFEISAASTAGTGSPSSTRSRSARWSVRTATGAALRVGEARCGRS
jgi:hypothetical protein